MRPLVHQHLTNAGRVVVAIEPRVEVRKWRRFMVVRGEVLAGLASGVQGWKWELACDRGIGDWGLGIGVSCGGNGFVGDKICFVVESRDCE
jgi:hypothetical protein